MLVGRDSELAMLVGLVKGAAAGQGGAVLIEGEPASARSRWCRRWRQRRGQTAARCSGGPVTSWAGQCRKPEKVT